MKTNCDRCFCPEFKPLDFNERMCGICTHGKSSHQPQIPLARNSDPATSHEAAREVRASGRHGSQVEKIHAAAVAAPGSVAGELCEATGFTMHVVSRRLAELKNDLRLKQGEPRKYNNRNQVTWWPVEGEMK